jgi:hypothetical protein
MRPGDVCVVRTEEGDNHLVIVEGRDRDVCEPDAMSEEAEDVELLSYRGSPSLAKGTWIKFVANVGSQAAGSSMPSNCWRVTRRCTSCCCVTKLETPSGANTIQEQWASFVNRSFRALESAARVFFYDLLWSYEIREVPRAAVVGTAPIAGDDRLVCGSTNEGQALRAHTTATNDAVVPYCGVCQKGFNSDTVLQDHLRGAPHQKALNRARVAVATPRPIVDVPCFLF